MRKMTGTIVGLFVTVLVITGAVSLLVHLNAENQTTAFYVAGTVLITAAGLILRKDEDDA